MLARRWRTKWSRTAWPITRLNISRSLIQTLISTADLYGEHEISRILGQNLREEEEMAAWIEQNHPKTLAIYIQRSLEDLQAKR